MSSWGGISIISTPSSNSCFLTTSLATANTLLFNNFGEVVLFPSEGYVAKAVKAHEAPDAPESQGVIEEESDLPPPIQEALLLLRVSRYVPMEI